MVATSCTRAATSLAGAGAVARVVLELSKRAGIEVHISDSDGGEYLPSVDAAANVSRR